MAQEEHKCIHEVDLAIMAQSQERIESVIKEILKLLKGDNNQGLITKTALLSQSISRMWWWVGGISISIMGIALFVIRIYLIK